MSTQRFTPEFKEEAVRQVIERGVSTHSLYKWVKAVAPDKTEQRAGELLEAKSEILRLRAQLRRTEKERDILKKAARQIAHHLYRGGAYRIAIPKHQLTLVKP